jgi:AcrR family transcriptional regulator
MPPARETPPTAAKARAAGGSAAAAAAAGGAVGGSAAVDAAPRARRTAGERRLELVDVALRHFSVTGLHGTSTEAIARDAGISHPYLFRLFGTKKELFLACAEKTNERTRETFRDAAATWRESGAESVLQAMGKAYVQMLADRDLLRMQMQIWAACSDPEIRAAAAEHYRLTFEEVERLSGAPLEEVRVFFKSGMLLNVAAAMGLSELAGREPWVARLVEHLEELPG